MHIKNTAQWIILYTVIITGCFLVPPTTIHAEELFNIQGITIENTQNTVKIHWSEVEACDRYEVTVIDSSEGKIEVLLDGSSAAFEGRPGEFYRIKIMAWNGEQLVAESAVIEIKIPGKVETIQTTRVSEKSVHLVWNQVQYANYYEVRRKQKQSGEYETVKLIRETDFHDKTIKENQNYVYQVVPLFKADTSILYGESMEYSFNNKEIVDTMDARYTYKEYEADVKQLQMKYAQYCTVSVIGKTADNRNLYKIELGNPDAARHLLVVANLHAREYMTSLLCMKQIEYYLENYNKSVAGCKPADLLDNISIIYIPMANPDGTTIVQEGISGIASAQLRKKLYAIRGTGSVTDWKANVNGVDLNRNFEFGFGKGSSKKPDFAGYAGKYALSENETKAIVQDIKKLNKSGHKIAAIINYHAAGEIIFGGFTAPVSKNTRLVTQKMYSCAQKITGYRNAEKVYKDVANGDFRSYHMSVLNIPGITLEIGKWKTPIPHNEFAQIWKKNKSLILEEVKVIQ